MLSPELQAGPFAGALFQDIDFSGGALAAVSGGSDSIALLLLLKCHLDRYFPAAPLLAVTIDHALRAESAAEAAAVATLCARHGIRHRTMVWTAEKPTHGLPAAARQARYRLLSEAAADSGIAAVFTGHTADDQAETVLMRQARAGHGSQGRGLAGMAPATLYDGAVWIMRPLLGARRAELRGLLRRKGIAWADDPTNTDSAYERPRIRTALASDAARFPAALATAHASALARIELNGLAAALIRSHATLVSAGLVRLAPDFASCGMGNRPATVHALRLLLATMGGRAFLPDLAVTQALLERLAGDPLRATLSRTVVDARGAGIFLHRERRGFPPAQPFCNGMVWDGRRKTTFDAVAPNWMIAPREGQGRPFDEVEGVPDSLVRAALAAEPVLRPPAPGAMAGPAVQPVVAPFAGFLPCFDLEPARALARLVGAASIPEPPLRAVAAGGSARNA